MPEYIKEDDEEHNEHVNNQLTGNDFLDSIAINKENPIVRDMVCEQKEQLENEFRMDRGHIMV